MTPTYEKAWKDNWGNHRLVSLSPVPRKGMEQITWSAITRCELHLWDIRSKQVLLD